LAISKEVQAMINRFFILATLLCVGVHPAGAQSTIQLPPSIDLGAPAPRAAPPAPAASCLGGTDGACTGSEAAVTFSFSDVLNLGIIDREEAAAVIPAGQSENAQAMAQSLPSIDLDVLFDYDSDRLRPDQMPQLLQLADQLRRIDLSQGYVVVMGHTDAVGSAAYNDNLSLRRAQTVAGFLRDSAGLPAHRIRPSGQGFRFLKFPDQPTHGANRRVQIILAVQGG